MTIATDATSDKTSPAGDPSAPLISDRVVTARGVRVELDSGAPIVEGLDLDLAPGEILGVVGESGSGKTTAVLALLGYASTGTRIAAGDLDVAGHRILELDERARRRLRGRVISYVPQDAAQALNPALRIDASIKDVAREHRRVTDEDIRAMLAAVELPSTDAFARRLPHQLSGGQQQRVTIAMALAASPPVVVMDEPTTGLDVVTQAGVLREVAKLRDELGTAVIYVSHDLAVVSQIADRVAVMYAGNIVEQGATGTILDRPRHPYTRGLVQSIPDHRRPAQLVPMPGTAVGVEGRPDGCAFAPRCPLRIDECDHALPILAPVLTSAQPTSVATLTAGSPVPTEWQTSHLVRCPRHQLTPPVALGEPRRSVDVNGRGAEAQPLLAVRGLSATYRSRSDVVVAADDVSLHLGAGECLALVGESGSGKTTIARCIAGLHLPDRGEIELDGTALSKRVRARSVEQRRRLQYVFQNPFHSLNPRRSIRDQLARPGQVLRGQSATQASLEVPALLEQVRLPRRTADRYPHQLSGGERQRVAIARALAAHPDVLICDEITSALDVSVQAAVLEVLSELRDNLSLAVLLITHDLGVVSVAADRVAVLDRGVICETGPVEQILTDPSTEYARQLIDAAPTLAAAGRSQPQ